MPSLHRASIETPIGGMLALASDEGLCALDFVSTSDHRLAERLRRRFPSHEIDDRSAPAIEATRQWLAAYFEGSSAAAGRVRLDLRGSPFERRVWSALVAIPPGATSSYGAIAKALGSPGSARAVGAANGANPVAVIVPCHRVIGSNGSLIGYGGGLDRKAWLLAHEARWRTGQLELRGLQVVP